MSKQRDNYGAGEVAQMLANHLQDEEAVLAEALEVVHALRPAVTQLVRENLAEMAGQQHRLATLLTEMKKRRQGFREKMAARLKCPLETITVTRILAGLPTEQQEIFSAWSERVRQTAHDFLANQRWLSIHLRIYQDAYQFLLCNITGTAKGSGRYGRAGQSEAGKFRPLIQIQG